MAKHNDLGKLGEDLAVNYLRDQGYDILERNWVFQKAEIDIIAQKNEALIIVEVKTRSNLEFGNPQDFVNPKKIKLLVKAVNEYVTLNDLDCNTRFDIIAIKKDATKYEIEHLQDAFYYF
ncbi:YraN family protein [Flavobacterium sp. SM15]|uniref:YraN family protein n=1 Tax=Flavobacterium sp. SM15 TaxID=2908005 RepID=UPI001EDBFCAA|nr:YraN family protein [Flavobacterium sp. SM15]MCG2610251.1 YraN family protein [Flavobacterium sp. SM15]